jgi:uncharacterized protein
MPDYTYPGVYVEEVPSGGPPPITGVPTSIAVFVDCFARGPLHRPVQVFSFTEFEHQFGGLPASGEAGHALQLFFHNGGTRAYVVRVPSGSDGDGPDAAALPGDEEAGTGIYSLKEVDLFNLLCIPALGRKADDAFDEVYRQAMDYCERRRAFFLIDTPAGMDSPGKIMGWLDKKKDLLRHKNAALYFPRIAVADPRNKKLSRTIGAAGAMAGLCARTDSRWGVWKAPAGVDAVLHQVNGLTYPVNDLENGMLSSNGINCLRSLPAQGIVSWGSRTTMGSDALSSEWKYASVRRLALHLGESLQRGLLWAVFEPNDEPLWNRIRQSAGNFLHGLLRQGAFQGFTTNQAYFVKCDRDTHTQSDISEGRINLLVGFAPLRPAEFLVLSIRLSGAA